MNWHNSRYVADAANYQNQRRINTGRSSAPTAARKPASAPVEEPLPLPEIPMDRMLTTKQAAMILGVSFETLKKWRQRRKRPQFLRYPDGAIRYRLSVIMRFLANCTVEP
jgi:DNA-binding transcriptional regulator YiaG